jgi:hypothetical protein
MAGFLVIGNVASDVGDAALGVGTAPAEEVKFLSSDDNYDDDDDDQDK